MLHEIKSYDIYHLIAQLYRRGDPAAMLVKDEFDEKRLHYHLRATGGAGRKLEVVCALTHDESGEHWDYSLADVSKQACPVYHLPQPQIRWLYDLLRARIANIPENTPIKPNKPENL